MHEAGHDRERDLLLEAFLAGWQAALAVRITHPRVLAVIESCFEGWLLEAADEVEVFGLPFRRREELPHLVRARAPERSHVVEPASDPVAAPTPAPTPGPVWTPVTSPAV
jgi:hypothetical protein